MPMHYLQPDQVVVVVRREHGLARQQLAEDGAHRPDVHGLLVMVKMCDSDTFMGCARWWLLMVKMCGSDYVYLYMG